jgi:hypothetical protein
VRPCSRCGEEFTPSKRDPRIHYCSKTCSRAANEIKRLVRVKPCATCGELFEYTHNTRKRRHCEHCHRPRHAPPNGEICDLPLASCRCCRTVFVARGRTTCGRVRCYHRLRYSKRQDHQCDTCGALIVYAFGRPRRWCSDQCERQSPEFKAAQQRAKRARRATKRGAKHESYDPREIFERDGYRCQLCGGKLHRTAKVPHPKAPTIDHIVPLAKGGDDIRANVHAAHFICNALKGDRGGGEQLLLVG